MSGGPRECALALILSGRGFRVQGLGVALQGLGVFSLGSAVFIKRSLCLKSFALAATEPGNPKSLLVTSLLSEPAEQEDLHCLQQPSKRRTLPAPPAMQDVRTRKEAYNSKAQDPKAHLQPFQGLL